MDHSISLNQDSLSKSYSKGSSFFGFKKLEPKIETSNLTPTSTTTTAFTNSSTEKTCNESFPLNSPISFELIVDDLIDYWSLFPSNIQHSILQYTSPNLHQLLSVSKSFKLSIQNYVIKRTKLFKELKDEASTWGHKAPQLFEILASDPLIIQSIVNVVFDPNFSNDRSKEKDVEKMLPILHKHIFKSFEAAINNYSQYYTAIPHLVSIIHKYRMNYIYYSKSITHFPDSTTKPELPLGSLDSIQSTEAIEKTFNQDESWIQWNDELILLASNQGHTSNFPSFSELSKEKSVSLYKKAMTNSLHCGSVKGLFITMESSKRLGHFWSFLNKALKVATQQLTNSNTNEAKLRNMCVLLLNYVFNDNDGPYVSKHLHLNHANNLILRAEELKHEKGIQWNYCVKNRVFKMIRNSQALDVIFEQCL